MKNLMKVLLFAALFAATFAKPLCSNNCGSSDETQNQIDDLKFLLDAEGLKATIKLLESFNSASSNTTDLQLSPRIVGASPVAGTDVGQKAMGAIASN
jgi:hypothetical protein